ncbi:hypothetical protein GCM10027168_74470 [Streptomyces capparidis]
MTAPAAPAQPAAGPRGMPLLGNLITFGRNPQEFLVRLREDHGDVVTWSLGPRPCVLLSHPRRIAAVLSRAGDLFEPADMGWPVHQIARGSVGIARGEEWRRKRATVQPVVRPRHVREFAATMSACAAEHAASWSDGDRIDVQREMTRVTGQIVARTLFGDAPEMNADVLHRAMAALQRELAAQVRGGVGLLLPGWVRTPSRQRLLTARRTIDATLDELIRRRRARPDRGAGGGTVLDALLESRDEQGRAMTPAEARDEAVALWIGGHETTAAALTWTWLALSRTPRARLRLTEELDRVLAGRTPTHDDYDRLPWTRKVVKEGLRLYPPFWTLVMTPLRDTEVDGVRFAAESLVWCSPWSTHRDPRWFPDPLAFRPERWDAPEPLTDQAWFPFGSGPRACLGARFAQVEAVLVLAAQAQRFHLDFESDAARPLSGPFLQPSAPLHATVRTAAPPSSG